MTVDIRPGVAPAPNEEALVEYLKRGMEVSTAVARYSSVDRQVYADTASVIINYTNGSIVEDTSIAFDSVAGQNMLATLHPGANPATDPPELTVRLTNLVVNAAIAIRGPDGSGEYVWDGTRWSQIIDFNNDGVRFSAGSEFTERFIDTGAKPFEAADAWIQLVSPVSPAGSTTLDVTDNNFSWLNHVIPSAPTLNQRMMTPTTNDGTSWARFRFTDADPGVQINLTWTMYKHVSDVEEYEIRVGATDGALVDTFTYGPIEDQTWVSPSASYTPTTTDVTNGYLDLYLVRTSNSVNTANQMGVANYGFGVELARPAQNPNVVTQMDSYFKGTMLPSIFPSSTATHDAGAMALDRLSGNRPIWFDGEDWAYPNTTRPQFRSIDSGQFFFAEGGTFNSAGWTGSNHNRLVYTENFQGFPAVIRCTQSGGTITIQGPNNTQALWDVAFANGFRVDYRMMFGATFDGQVWMDIEPNNTSWGGVGRFEANITVNTGQLQMTCINSGGNTTFDLERDIMHTISMICPAGSNTAEMHVEGVKVGEVTYGGSGSTERGTFFYIPPGNAVNDFCFQSITTYTLPAADQEVLLGRRAIETGLRYNIPNINQSIRLRVPKGLYDFGNTIAIVNGSTEPAIISGEADDHQLFGGVSEFEIPPNTEITLTEAGFPRGNVWSASGGKTVVNHDTITTGNSLILTVDSAATVTGRHGTYLGDDVVVSSVGTGQYQIAVTSALFDDATSVSITPKHTAGQQMTGNYGISVGAVIVDILQAGTLVNDSFTVEIYW